MLPQLRRLYQDSEWYYRCIYSSITGELNQFFTSCKNTKNEGLYSTWVFAVASILASTGDSLLLISFIASLLSPLLPYSPTVYTGGVGYRFSTMWAVLMVVLTSGTSHQRVQLGSFGIMLLPSNWFVIMCCLGYLPTSLFGTVLPFSCRAETKTAKSYKRY